jgi:hypothetical protein
MPSDPDLEARVRRLEVAVQGHLPFGYWFSSIAFQWLVAIEIGHDALVANTVPAEDLRGAILLQTSA